VGGTLGFFAKKASDSGVGMVMTAKNLGRETRSSCVVGGPICSSRRPEDRDVSPDRSDSEKEMVGGSDRIVGRWVFAVYRCR
jgi:hypothetical protein